MTIRKLLYAFLLVVLIESLSRESVVYLCIIIYHQELTLLSHLPSLLNKQNEAQYYSTRIENSRIDNGHALIDARKDNWNGHTYTSASRTTKGKKTFLYGRFSLRAKIDVRSGSWPAWWWLPETGGWPIGGEIDMMEYYQWKLLFNVMDGSKVCSFDVII